MYFAWSERAQDESVHLLFEKLASVTDIHRSLNLVASQYPDFDASLTDVVDCLGDIFLQLVLNRS